MEDQKQLKDDIEALLARSADLQQQAAQLQRQANELSEQMKEIQKRQAEITASINKSVGLRTGELP